MHSGGRIACVFVVAVALAACSSHAPESASAPEAAPAKPGVVVVEPNSPKLALIRVAEGQKVEAPGEDVVVPGRIELNPNRITRVMLPVAGRIAKVEVKLGDMVREGDKVLEIQSSDADAAEAALIQSESALAQAKSMRAKAQADLDRITDLYQHQAIAKKEVLNAENEVARNTATITQAQAALDQAKQRLELMGLRPGVAGQRVPVRAPISGKVFEIAVVAGEFRNNTAEPLLKIADVRKVWMTSDVPESHLRFCRIGAPVELELVAFPGSVLRGTIARIAESVDPQTRTLKVSAELDNSAGRLLPEMSGKIRFTDAPRLVAVFDEGALLHVDGKTMVYVQEAPGRFVEREVTLGPRVGHRLTATSGLQGGERVVVEGSIYLKSGI